ncbi:MAG: gliding motility protein GldN [Bacteroidaceae bacterium]|nr:gliding motility protein GldN [Bacteroidaceae bacterium]
MTIHKYLLISALMLGCTQLSAQPAQSRVQNNQTRTTTGTATRTTGTTTGTATRTTGTTTGTATRTTGTTTRTTTANRNAAAQQTPSRASLMFPTTVEQPADASWRRDIYRELDLTKDENAALYYPVEPMANGQVNLFTLLFQLLNTGKIPAYTYDPSGLENFNQDNRMHFKDMLDRFEIPYEVNGNSIKVEPVDVPSAEVLSYFVKESSYYDQHTATYHSRVTAICPVMHRAGNVIDFNSPGFASDVQKNPLFWVKIEDIETYLSQHEVMTSNINNAATMSLADFFATNKYKGTIYMTANMQGKSLIQEAGSDTALVAAQKKIEKEMVDFEQHIWHAPVDSAELARKDSIAAAEQAAKKAKKSTSTSSRTSARASKSEKSSNSGSSSSGSSAPRVSVRRERH